MHALKALVIGMGVLIALVMGVMAYGLMKKASDPDFTFFDFARPPAAADIRPGAAFGDVLVPLGPGCRIEDMKPDGNRLFLRVGPADGACQQIVVIDLASGKIMGNVKVWNAK
ncbi:hypothetical protein [Shumkonia mesophila]|uniref:hypothetical protein n=1 Tax=Shumkonia mesophila TaxID=2838854 RepID=UPI002934C2FD|nr:hypothetical protein [Shumkonia mesophila]